MKISFQTLRNLTKLSNITLKTSANSTSTLKPLRPFEELGATKRREGTAGGTAFLDGLARPVMEQPGQLKYPGLEALEPRGGANGDTGRFDPVKLSTLDLQTLTSKTTKTLTSKTTKTLNTLQTLTSKTAHVVLALHQPILHETLN